MHKASLKNQTLLCILAWRLHSCLSSFWVKVLTSKYRHTNFEQLPYTSKVWRKISRSWEVCKEGTYWAVHDGTKVNFCTDRWISNLSPLISSFKGPSLISLICSFLSFSIRGLGTLILPPLKSPWISNIIIHTFMPSLSITMDSPLCFLNGKKSFSCKSVYALLSKKASNVTLPFFLRTGFGSLKFPPRFNTFSGYCSTTVCLPKLV